MYRHVARRGEADVIPYRYRAIHPCGLRGLLWAQARRTCATRPKSLAWFSSPRRHAGECCRLSRTPAISWNRHPPNRSFLIHSPIRAGIFPRPRPPRDPPIPAPPWKVFTQTIAVAARAIPVRFHRPRRQPVAGSGSIRFRRKIRCRSRRDPTRSNNADRRGSDARSHRSVWGAESLGGVFGER